MPELPEVETVVRSLQAVLPGRRIVCARCYSALVTR
ncbi:MAG: DNA-formamidopyrimidine glycosylase family protein, partial [Bryobacteraceae bacterium]